MNHEMLMETTKAMPMKTIMVNGEAYLERYFVGYSSAGFADDGGQWWFHRFLRNDSERHLHSHPWEGRATVLVGGYKEQSRGPSQDINDGQHDHFRYYRVGQHNTIYPQTLHRIIEVEPNTWTLIHVKAGRLPQWFFIDDEGNKQLMDASPENWHEQYGQRKSA